jgi:hypothetical protein
LTVNRFLAGIFAASLVVAACGGAAPGTSPGAGGTPGAGGGDAALAELCGTGDGSLSSITTELEQMDENTDATQLSTQMGTAMSNLENADVDEGATAARDAALTALQQLQAVINDPAARQQLSTQAAQAMRTLDSQICM